MVLRCRANSTAAVRRSGGLAIALVKSNVKAEVGDKR
jgi:hypothetical protein